MSRAAVILLLFLSGCLMDSPAEVTDPGPDPDPDADRGYPRNALWTGCEGFGASFDWVGHHDQFDPPPHSAWEDPVDEGTLVTGLIMYGLECDRFTLGGFERPIRFYIEIADLDATPPNCERDNITISYDALESIWVDDEDVVRYLQTVYDMPAIYAEIKTVLDETGTYDKYNWTMIQKDGSASWYELQSFEDYTGNTPTNFRLFWWNDTALGYMDWTIFVDQYTNSVATGHLEPPSIMSGWQTEYAGFGAIRKDARATGSIALFEDLVCQKPR